MKLPLFIAATAALLLFPAPAGAVNFELSSLDDDGSGSLRKIFQSASTPTGDYVLADPAIDGGTITLTSGELAEDVAAGRTVEIDASNLPNGLTIEAGNNSRIFRFTGSGRVILRNITLRAGQPGSGDPSAPDGGAIHSEVTLELYDCTILSNSCSPAAAGADGGSGGGIYSTGNLSLEGCTFSGNRAATGGDGEGASGGTGGDGGAVYVSGDLFAIDSRFQLNRAGDGGSADGTNTGGDGGHGGAIHVTGNVILEECEFSSNRAGSGGTPSDSGSGGNGGSAGAVHFGDGSTLLATRSIFTLNEAGAGGNGGANAGDGGNAGPGGALFLTGTFGEIERCSFVENKTGNAGAMGPAGADGAGADGGAIFHEALTALHRIDITNTLIAFNGASENGGGLYFSSSAGSGNVAVSLVHATVTENTSVGPGGGLDGNGGRLNFEGTIVAGNSVGAPPGIPLDRNNTFSNTGNSGSNLSPLNQNHISDDPQLGPVGIFGGDIISMLPLAGSPVLNSAAVTDNTPLVDQRGFVRNFGSAPDIGATEISFQADNRIGLKANTRTHKVDDFYTPNGARQKLTLRLKGRKRGKAFLSMENDGDRDGLLLRATNPGRKLKFKVLRTSGGRKNVTAALKRSGYEEDAVDRGNVVAFQIQTGGKSRKRGTRKRIGFSTSSAATPGALDVSILTVKVRK